MAEKCRICKAELNDENWYPFNKIMNRKLCKTCSNKLGFKYRKEHPEKSKEYRTRCRRKLKEEIFRLLGGKCSNPNCAVPNGMKDIRALQIDHVHGKGRDERKVFKATYTYYLHVRNEILKGSIEYQLLCANCNWIKRFERKESL